MLVGAVWLPLLTRLSLSWRSDPELWHGWAVPLVAMGIARVRWQEWSGPMPVSRRARRLGEWGYGVALVLSLALLPVIEANPAWPSAQWLGAGLATIATLSILAAWGGRDAWRTFGFPLFFMHTALAAPALVKEPVMDFLMQSNAFIAAEVLSLLGKTAVVRGNLIEVEAGVIGVEEACSGLRSLQAVWMFAWMFGAVNRLRWSGRWQVVGFAVAAAWVGNLGRTMVLTWRMEDAGIAAGEAWHDASGVIALVLTLGAVFALAVRVESRQVVAPEVTAATTIAPRPVPLQRRLNVRSRWVAVVVVLVVVTEAATAWWYDAPGEATRFEHWYLQGAPERWKEVPVDAGVREALACSGADQLEQTPAPGQPRGMGLVMRWQRDRTMFAAGALAHAPTVCMPAIGGRLQRELPSVEVRLPDGELRFAAYVFHTRGRTQHVFNAGWNVQTESPIVVTSGAAGSSIRRERLARVARRTKFSEIDRVVLVVEDAVDDDAAVAWLRATVAELLIRRQD